MNYNRDLAVSHLEGAEQSLALLKIYMQGKVEHEEKDIRWQMMRARICLTKAEKVFSEGSTEGGDKDAQEATGPMA